MAILERKNFKITFDFLGNRYQLFEMDVSVNPPVYKKANGRFGNLFCTPQGVGLMGNVKDIIFYPDGHCDELKVDVLAKGAGYSVSVKRFGNIVEIKEAKVE